MIAPATIPSMIFSRAGGEHGEESVPAVNDTHGHPIFSRRQPDRQTPHLLCPYKLPVAEVFSFITVLTEIAVPWSMTDRPRAGVLMGSQQSALPWAQLASVEEGQMEHHGKVTEPCASGEALLP